jgi:lactose/L-arabinose transport system permease protein
VSLVATVLATLPVIALFFLMQRQFVAGMLGSVK